VLERLEALVDSSLVQRTTGADVEPRFGMLETIREYAAERLAESGELERVRTRHRDWCADWAERAYAELTGPDQLAWYSRLTDELQNFRAAREWSRQDPGGAEAGLRIAGALGRYFQVRDPGREGRQWLAQALADCPTGPSAARSRALTWCGQLDYRHGEAEIGRTRLEEAVDKARRVGDGSLLCLTLRHLALYAADRAAAPALLEEAVAVARAAGDQRELAFALCYLGIARRQRGDDAAAAELYAEAVAAGRASGDLAALGAVLAMVGELHGDCGEYDSAQSLLEEALELFRALDYRSYITTINQQLADLAMARGDMDAVGARVRSSLEIARASDEGVPALHSLSLAARLAGASGDHRRAVRLFAAVVGWHDRHDVGSGLATGAGWGLPEDDEALTAARAALGEQEFAAAWAAGRLLSLDDAFDEALAADGGGHA
jgi:tetratricopeptide (TPR) repeat protein